MSKFKLIAAIGLTVAVLSLAALPLKQGGFSSAGDPAIRGLAAHGALTPAPRIGEAIATDQFHLVSRPGLYGLARAPHGQGFGIAQDKLFRYDSQSMRVLSVIRQVDRIKD